jgi:hypothetical protein
MRDVESAMSAQSSATSQPAAELDSAATQEPEGFKQIANIRPISTFDGETS